MLRPAVPTALLKKVAVTAFGLTLALTLAACSAPGSDSATPTTVPADAMTTTLPPTTTTVMASTTMRSTTAPPTSAAPAPPPTLIADECTADAITVTHDAAAGGAAAGTAYSLLVFTNRSPGPCNMRGYPGVSYVDAQGRQVGGSSPSAPTNGADQAIVPVPPGGRAYSRFEVHDALFGSPACGPQLPTTAMRVYIPDSTTPIDIPESGPQCSAAEAVFGAGPVSASPGPV